MRQQLWLEAFAKCGSIGEACAATGIPVPTAEHWASVDSYGFKRRKAWAAQMALGKLEAEIHRRGVEGVEKKYFNTKGELTGSTIQYSDNLLMFRTKRTKRLDPEYRDNYSDKPESGAAPVTQIIINLAPGVEMPAEVEGQTQYREVRPAAEGEYREIPEEKES